MNTGKTLLQRVRLLAILPGIRWKDKKFRADLARWKQILGWSGSEKTVLARLLWEKKEFRNLLCYRSRHRPLYRRWIGLWYRPMDTLFLEAEQIGGGLFIQHGFATMVSARVIGKNCWINQQVTVGYKDGGCPVIGDDVMITCGAKVLGPVTLGNGAVIGANAVVIRDVEPMAVMGGVPAKKLRTRQPQELLTRSVPVREPFSRRVGGWLQRRRRSRKIRAARRLLRNDRVCLISQNCIGGVFSRDMGMPHRSPTVGLYFEAEDFLRFVSDLPRYLAMELQMEENGPYPKGRLEDVTVHFLHYPSSREAQQAWNRRKTRIRLGRILVLCTDMEGFTPQVFAKWRQLPYPKLLFTANAAYAREPDSVYFPQFREKVADLIPERLFYQDDALVTAVNRLAHSSRYR